MQEALFQQVKGATEERHVGPDPQEEAVHPWKWDEPRQTGPYLVGLATPIAVKGNHTGTTSHTAPRQKHLKEGQRTREERRASRQSPAGHRGEEKQGVVNQHQNTS
ncbi:hypothetical protein EYF80_009674 [Liparis tanakae]|uniref:Uncharacterized protein n=1 Tax=Liparis tanakae TaxID=230148 RepID=A0A4Z2IQ42_9TELE|nr:hypothetical protein EYF80_009674 [Liparis tanakae]